MAEVTLTINGKNYGISCDDGQEQRVLDLGNYVDQRMREMSAAGAATNESHLLVLTSILMADEIFDLRDQADKAESDTSKPNGQDTIEDESEIIGAIDQLAGRINSIADRLQGV